MSGLIFLLLQNRAPDFYSLIPEFLNSMSVLLWTWGIHRQLLALKQNCFCCHLPQYDAWPTFTSWHKTLIFRYWASCFIWLREKKTCPFLYCHLKWMSPLQGVYSFLSKSNVGVSAVWKFCQCIKLYLLVTTNLDNLIFDFPDFACCEVCRLGLKWLDLVSAKKPRQWSHDTKNINIVSLDSYSYSVYCRNGEGREGKMTRYFVLK